MTNTFIILLCVAGAVLGKDSTIRSNNGGPWGDWGSESHCPPNSFATGFAIKVERPVGDSDDTSINGIKLFCTSGNDGSETEVTSNQQQWGSWTDRRQCPHGRLTSMRLRVEGRQGSGDDTAANNLDMRCQNGQELGGGGNNWGDWSPWETCQLGQAICGLQTRVEGTQAGDDTALNDVIFLCCRQ
uniref:Vitelline membrane outer layer protein I-like protein n=1 Tax=Pacifastacus leniusculus TaxID=6720 RepID=Q52WZ4_PACLE|nr:vitelline membrane outer layer protein I-like protein [Pacifastacus leniusculus]